SADDALIVFRSEGQAFCRQASFAQALCGLAKPPFAKGAIEQRFAGRNIDGKLVTDRDHGIPLLPALSRGRIQTERSGGRRAGRGRLRRCQMWTVFSGAKPLKATAE